MNLGIKKIKHYSGRDLIIKILKYPFGYRRRAKLRNMLSLESKKERFAEIYRLNLWSSQESCSGEGSEIEYTEPLRKWLITTIKDLELKKIVDAPCGDFNWMKLVLPEVNCEYIGCDIVEEVIEKNQYLYAADDVSFNVADICTDDIPECDLLIVRDCLFHLSYEDIQRALKNLSRTKYKYLLTTTHIVDDGFQNTNIISGDFRLIDLFKNPFMFNVDKVRDRIHDYPVGHRVKREMLLLEKADVPKCLSV